MNDEPIVVSHNKEAHRYEVHIDSHYAVLTYKLKKREITFLHTGVPPALEGRGIANELAHTALEDAREQHLIVVPACPFVFAYIQRHREYLPLVAETEQARFHP